MDYKTEMLPHEIVALDKFLAEVKPDISLEIGRYLGGSLSIIAKHSKLTYSIDPMPFNNFIPRTAIIVGKSPEDLSVIPEMQIDFIFIDGDHTYESVMADISAALLFSPKHIILHDSEMPDVAQAIDSYPWNNYSPQRNWVPGIQSVPHPLGRCRVGQPAYGMALITAT